VPPITRLVASWLPVFEFWCVSRSKQTLRGFCAGKLDNRVAVLDEIRFAGKFASMRAIAFSV
jgi:hypothetical protein